MSDIDQTDKENTPNPQKMKGGSGTLQIPDLHDVLEIKESRDRKRRQYSSLFLSIGLCLSLLMVISAFQHKFYDESGVTSLGKIDENFEKTIEIPPTEQPPPPPPKVQQTQIIEVSNDQEIEQDIKVNLDIEVNEETKVAPAVVVAQAAPVEDEEAQQIFTIVENQPEPDGGMTAFYKYVGENLKYPNLARRNNIEGRVFIKFVVERDGKLTDVQVLKGIGGGCDEEAVRVIAAAPKWKPGKQRGRPVRVQMILPVVFKLEI
jgi:periplasmic protein TonB